MESLFQTRKRRERAIASLGVFGLAVALYTNSLAGDFVFDDHTAIEINPDVRSNSHLSEVFRNDFWGMPLSDPESHKSYRPLTVLSFRLNRQLHGLWSPGFHGVNVAAHALVSVLYYWSCLGFGMRGTPSLIASLLFAAHPIHTEAVANIVGRSEMLAAIFFLLALIAYQRASRTGSLIRSLAWTCLTLALTSVSLLCKEQGVTVLGLCLVWDLFLAVNMKRNIQKQPRQTNPRYSAHLNCTIRRTSVVISAAIVLVFVRVHLIGGGTPTFVDSDNPASFSPHLLTRLLTYCYLCPVNVWLLLCPFGLCHDWSMGSVPLIESLTDPRNCATISLGLLSSVLVWRVFTNERKMSRTDSVALETTHCFINGHSNININSNNNNNAANVIHAPPTAHCTRKTTIKTGHKLHKYRSPSISPHYSTLLALSWIVIPFLPASNLFFPVGFVIAERVLYLPSMGYCLLLAIGINIFWVRKKRFCLSLLSFLLLIFTAKTVLRNAEWSTTGRITQSALVVNPGNAKVQMSMGNELAQQGDRKCELFYREAIRLRPQYASAWANLGLILINTDRPQEAEEAYRTALFHKPDHINGNTNMAHLCRLQGRWREARDYFMIALQRRPRTPTLHYYAGLASEELSSAQDLQVAEREYGLAVQYSPHHPEAHHRLGKLLATTGSPSPTPPHTQQDKKRLLKAVFHYKKAAQLKSEDPAVHYELGSLLLSLGQLSEAEGCFLHTTRLSPTHSQAHKQLARLYPPLGKPHTAEDHLQKEPLSSSFDSRIPKG